MANPNVHGTKPLKEVGCDDPCSFCVRSREDDELVRDYQWHVKSYHNMDLPRADAIKAIRLAVAA